MRDLNMLAYAGMTAPRFFLLAYVEDRAGQFKTEKQTGATRDGLCKGAGLFARS